ncbi:hypothetical protein Tco_0914875, partial [Tanacetum coccineum]
RITKALGCKGYDYVLIGYHALKILDTLHLYMLLWARNSLYFEQGINKARDTVMSDSEDSTVTYTVVSSPFGGLLDIGSLGVDGPPVMPEDPYAYVVAAFQAPPSPDYVSGLEYPHSPDFVPEPVYPEFMPSEDEVLPAEEQPLPAALSPTADSPSYVPESDLEEDPEEDDNEDPKEDPADYPTDGGDDGDDEDESSDDDEDDDVDIEGDEEEEEHPAPTDSTAVALPAVEHAPSAKETKPFKTDESAATPPPHPAYRVTAKISIRDEPPTPFWSDTEVARLLAIPTPPPSPLSSWSSPLPQIPSPPLPPILSPLRVSSSPPASPTYPLGYRAAMIRPEVCLPPRKRLCFAFGPRYENEMLVDMSGAPATDDTDLGRQMTEFSTRVRQDTDEIYVRDRRAHARTTLLMEREAMMSREAWGRSMDASDLARSKVMSLRTTVLGQQAVITELQAADRRRQAAITELLAADRMRQAQFIEKMAPKRAARSNTALETTNTTSVTNAQLQEMIDQGVTSSLAASDADRNTNDDDSHNSGTGARRTERTARECTYTDFLKCQPLNFKGTEGVAGLSQWFERMESVFHISNATCTLHSVALTWWNTHVKTVSHDATYGMP